MTCWIGSSSNLRLLGFLILPLSFHFEKLRFLLDTVPEGVILGFEQFRAQQGIRKCGTPKQMEVTNLKFPTEWNHIETGVLFSAGLPLLVFKEREIAGGIFDLGAADVFLHDMPNSTCSDVHKRQLSAVFLKWQADVRRHYYECCFK